MAIDLSGITDSGCAGLGTGAQMRFSNDGSTWTTAEAFALSKSWDITDSSYGGTSGDGSKSVYVEVSDVAHSWPMAGNRLPTTSWLSST